MNPEIVPIHRNEPLVDDGMLFVRTEGIVNTMIRTPLILAGLIVMAIGMPLQTSFSSTRTLDLTMYSDGSTHISTQIDVDTFSPDFEIDLFGPSVDNFVAVGEDGFLLSSEVIENKAIIDTFGSSSITVDYDIHDLISKEGRLWTFSFDSPSLLASPIYYTNLVNCASPIWVKVMHIPAESLPIALRHLWVAYRLRLTEFERRFSR